MDTEDGFTLAEMLAALLVLSGITLAIGEFTFLCMENWERSLSTIDYLRELRMAETYPIEETERSLISSGTPLTDPETGLIQAVPKLDRPPDCRFDLVGRTCR